MKRNQVRVNSDEVHRRGLGAFDVPRVAKWLMVVRRTGK